MLNKNNTKGFSLMAKTNSDLKLKGDLIKKIIAARFENKVPRVQDEWQRRFCKPNELPPHRLTFQSRKKGQPPKTAIDLLRLSQVLDVDPIALVDLSDPTRGGLEGIIRLFARRYLFDDGGRSGPLSFVRELFWASETWPPHYLTEENFNIDWFVHEFTHDAQLRRGYYPTIELAARGWDGFSPRVYYIAYRSAQPTVTNWIPFGAVIRSSTHVQLIESTGHTDEKDIIDKNSSTCFGTFFGDGSAEFKIASIHDFDVSFGPDCDLSRHVHFPA